MPSIRALVNETLASWVFDEFAIEDARDVSPRFRRFRVASASLRAKPCAAGDKLQVMVGEAGPRTFTPFAPDREAGKFDFLAYVHGTSPAAAWAREAQPGLRFRAFGPRGSLPLASLAGPVVMFGDETSLGAAKSLVDSRGAGGGVDGVKLVFECNDRGETELALAELGLRDAQLVPRAPDLAHIGSLEEQLRAALAQRPDATLVLTGHAQAIQAVRRRLKSGQVPVREQKVKAYWADGKKGLD